MTRNTRKDWKDAEKLVNRPELRLEASLRPPINKKNMPEYYEFVTVWRLAAPIESVWNEIEDSEHWPDWWKGVVKVVGLRPGDKSGVGKIIRTTWRSALPYTLEFDSEVIRIERLKMIEARAFGELEGVGLWTVTSEDVDRTRVRYDWKVKTTKPWMNYLAPIAKPFFRWNHDTIMNWGGKGLAKRLGCELISG